MKKETRTFGHIVLCLSVLSIIVLPLFWMLMTSLKGGRDVLAFPPKIIAFHMTLENYRTLFTQTSFLRYFVNSLKVALIVVLITDLTAALGAYSLSRFRFRGRKAIIIASLLGYMVAPIMIVIPFYLLMRYLGVSNPHVGLILAHAAFCFPFALWLMKSYIDDVPVELEKAARIDGANRWQVMTRVTFPYCVSGILSVSIFVFILSWNDYIFARILIASDRLKTIPVGIEDMYNATVVDWGLLMAAGVAVTVPILLGFVFLNKALMKGWGYTGIK